MSRPIDKEFEDADDTGVLDISGRNLRQFPVIPGDMLDFNYVFEADLSNNRFDKLPKEVISCKALVKLNCHHNSIRWLPPELNLLTNLKEVDFSRNFLPSIPNEICLMNLYSVNLSNNRLLSIPNNIGKLRNIQFLDLSCNSLKELPESLYTLSRLRHLNIHRNELRDLSDDIAQLRELQHLDVSSNLLIRLPVSLRHMEALQVFTADGNPLEYPPPQVCFRGLVHLCKYLEVLEKKGSDHHLFRSYQRDESLRRRNERTQKKNSAYRPVSMSTPVRNGGDDQMGLLDEMANLVNKTFGEKDGEKTPTGGMHWSVAQYMASSEGHGNQSKEEYREAAHRLYMQQEGNKSGRAPAPCPSSPAGSMSLDEISVTPTSNLPKRKSDENVYRSSTGESSSRTSSFSTGRSLPNEKFPRSGSWNSHMRIPSPVLPSKYVAASERTSEDWNRYEQAKPAAVTPPGTSNGDAQLSAEKTPTKTASSSQSKSPKKSPRNKRPAPLDTTKKQQNGDKGNDSDREGSLTPTNESPPPFPLDQSEEPTTPKDEDDNIFSDGLSSETANQVRKSVSLNSKVEVIPSTRKPSKPLPLPPKKTPSQNSISSNPPQSPDIIQELDCSPPSVRRLPSLSEMDKEHLAAEKEKDKVPVPAPEDGKWGKKLASPRKRKEKDVFKFLKENDSNYTVRRQQMQINIMLEKNQHVKKTVENLVGVQLSDDIGDWVMDGVILCQVVNILHPGTIATIHTPPPGQSLSRIKQTINISAFIDACKLLKVPEEELCSAGDIVELKDPLRVITCLQRVLQTKPGNLI